MAQVVGVGTGGRGDDRAPGSPTAAPDVGATVLAELAARFSAVCPPAQIEALVRTAIEDLRGSVSAEALPEMAVRLARHRLCAAQGYPRTEGIEVRGLTRTADAPSGRDRRPARRA